MKNTNTAAKPAVEIGSLVCYRTKAGSWNRATVKEFVDGPADKNGKPIPAVVLTFQNKNGETVEFKKLLRNVFVYTGKKAAAAAPAEAPAEA